MKVPQRFADGLVGRGVARITGHPLRVALSLISVAALCFTVVASAADTPSELERSVKAAFIYKFLNYADWPASAFADPSAPFVIGVVGADDIAAQLSELAADRTVEGRRVEVRRLRRDESATGVHVLFVGSRETAQLPALARAAAQHPTLIVTESADALRLGSAINLVVVDGRIRFDIAPDNADRAGVRLSSRLLAVARTVRERAD